MLHGFDSDNFFNLGSCMPTKGTADEGIKVVFLGVSNTEEDVISVVVVTLALSAVIELSVVETAVVEVVKP